MTCVICYNNHKWKKKIADSLRRDLCLGIRDLSVLGMSQDLGFTEKPLIRGGRDSKKDIDHGLRVRVLFGHVSSALKTFADMAENKKRYSVPKHVRGNGCKGAITLTGKGAGGGGQWGEKSIENGGLLYSRGTTLLVNSAVSGVGGSKQTILNGGQNTRNSDTRLAMDVLYVGRAT